MSLRICAKGHITGQRHCGLCGADAVAPVEYRQPVSMNRRERKRRNQDAQRDGQINYDQSRRESRVGCGPVGPNKVNNGGIAR